MTKYAYNYATTEDLEELKKNMSSDVKLYGHQLSVGVYTLYVVSVLKDSFKGKTLGEIRKLCTYFYCKASPYGKGDLIELIDTYYLIQKGSGGVITIQEIAKNSTSITQDSVKEEVL